MTLRLFGFAMRIAEISITDKENNVSLLLKLFLHRETYIGGGMHISRALSSLVIRVTKLKIQFNPS